MTTTATTPTTPWIWFDGQRYLLVPMTDEQINDMELWADEHLKPVGEACREALLEAAYR